MPMQRYAASYQRMRVYRIQRKINMPIEAAATLLSNMLNQSKYYPYMVQLLVGEVV